MTKITHHAKVLFTVNKPVRVVGHMQHPAMQAYGLWLHTQEIGWRCMIV
ncbi:MULTISPECIES: hypothetical protein [Roseobacteraceae]|uniref:Uncharacterized protein n=1 Tax=Falsiruegeria litorea TaxID=1280831 RepID=A0ABS5WRD2_9RHOB|nr:MULTISPECIES: hypothetical protein [Roseobacteraceae]MBT3141611.1 hypothetical protein [Falsiruegeria litorea]MBT8167248.1 hypothetical protein [Falsiruegeria litorea]